MFMELQSEKRFGSSRGAQCAAVPEHCAPTELPAGFSLQSITLRRCAAALQMQHTRRVSDD